MVKMKPTKVTKKEFQFTCRIPTKLRNIVDKRLLAIGFNTLSEYIRHLIINDINGIEETYGQFK